MYKCRDPGILGRNGGILVNCGTLLKLMRNHTFTAGIPADSRMTYDMAAGGINGRAATYVTGNRRQENNGRAGDVLERPGSRNRYHRRVQRRMLLLRSVDPSPDKTTRRPYRFSAESPALQPYIRGFQTIVSSHAGTYCHEFLSSFLLVSKSGTCCSRSDQNSGEWFLWTV